MRLEHATNYLKGFLIGTVDLVPGVSGGTVALLVGIYGRLIGALSAISSRGLWADIARLRIGGALRTVDAPFMVAVGLGVFTALLTLPGAIGHLLDNHPHLILGFFFGLVLASAVYVATLVREYTPALLFLGMVGAALTFLVVALDPTPDAVVPSPARYFFSGLVSICAMLMPGISGSLLLVNLGMYERIIDALRGFDPIVLVFCAGAVAGLVGFSRVIKWLLDRHHDRLMAVIVGILLGSTHLLWPWKKVVEGVPFSGQPNLLPRQYPEDPDTVWVVALMVLGAVLIALFEGVVRRKASAA